MKPLGNEELFHFCEHFSLILHAGISASDGLQILSEDSASPESQTIFRDMQQSMEEHGSLAHALKESGLFPGTMISYVAVGEETGCLDEVMASLADRYEQETEIRSQIRSAVSYPLLMLVMMGAVIAILLTKVLPIFSQVFHQMGMEMNGISRQLLHAGSLLSTYSALFLTVTALLIFLLLFLAFHSRGKKLAGKLLGRLPYLRKIPLALDYERLSQAVSMGLRAGLTPELSLELARDLITEPELVSRLDRTAELLNEGQSFAASLTSSGLYTGMDRRMIEAGQEAGALDQVLSRLSLRAHEQAVGRIFRVLSILEPFLVICLSLMVGLVLLSVMMPLFGVFSQMTV